MIETLLKSYGLEIEETVGVYDNYYALKRNGKLIMNATRDDLLVTGLLLVIAELTKESNERIKQMKTPYDAYS